MHPELHKSLGHEERSLPSGDFVPLNRRLAMRELLEKSGLCPVCHAGWLEHDWCPACGYRLEPARSWWADALRWFRWARQPGSPAGASRG